MESLAAGTPVIANPRGSLPELVRHGATGFQHNIDAAVAAVANLQAIDRGRCRREAEDRFSEHRMVDDYERLFRDVVTQKRMRRRSRPVRRHV